MGTLATYADAMREYAWNMGASVPDRAWLLTDYDVWVQNPHYHGPAVRHPEDDQDYDEGDVRAVIARADDADDADDYIPF